MLQKWERSYKAVISKRKKGLWASILRGILRFFSWIYLLIILGRKRLFDMGLMRSKRPHGPIIISIGNIVVGGTGKTPATMMIAREFYPQTKIAFLSRGYRSLAEKEEMPIVLSRGEGPLHSALYCGDEPCILSDNFPKALAYVGKQRQMSAHWAAEAGAELILIDDGMQHFALKRDYDVVVMDANDPFGQGYLIPGGYLREPPKGLERANLIILNHVHEQSRFLEVKEQIRKYSEAPVVGTVYESVGLIGFDGRGIPSIKGKKIGIFCSIAHPEYFEKTVTGLAAEVVDRYFIPDHMLFDLEALKKFAKQCREQGAELLVCTEKDKVKLTGSLTSAISVAWIKIRPKIVFGEEEWASFIGDVKKNLKVNS